ncbi:VOC family protein [Prauserella endophytica]|uniref:VOC domain-containing protein n=1 Tax=Prauserella endophytica TaxID=1592324 RepID=A0ABY2S775_9PSEU|nr:VOC family protein [Prauserella endophytica]TKG71697.1 hypothetical protein FCN18_09270 [Prauserella endophytica]
MMRRDDTDALIHPSSWAVERDDADGRTPRQRVDHMGFSVADLDRSVEWYSVLLRREPLWRRIWDARYLSDVVGYDDCRLDCALFELPGGIHLELLQYLHPEPTTVSMETFTVGNAHLCLTVDDLDAEFERLSAIAEFRSKTPVDVTWGPNAGGKIVYLRDPDGITVELFQEPARSDRHLGGSA